MATKAYQKPRFWIIKKAAVLHDELESGQPLFILDVGLLS
jgi:hypothetical protein